MTNLAASRREKLVVTQQLHAAPEALWRMLSSGARVERWFPWVAATLVEDPTEGGLRRIELKDGSVFDEYITLNDASRRTYQYYAPAPPLPIRHVIGTHRIEPHAAGGALFSWHVSFEVLPEAPADILAMLAELYRAAARQIDLAAARTDIHAPDA